MRGHQHGYDKETEGTKTPDRQTHSPTRAFSTPSRSGSPTGGPGSGRAGEVVGQPGRGRPHSGARAREGVDFETIDRAVASLDSGANRTAPRTPAPRTRNAYRTPAARTERPAGPAPASAMLDYVRLVSRSLDDERSRSSRLRFLLGSSDRCDRCEDRCDRCDLLSSSA